MQDLKVDDITINVPLDWDAPSDGRTIGVHAAVVTRDGGEQLPYLVFLQGGPGFEAPTPFHSPASPSWLDTALERYRVVLLDQRGTGSSTPISEEILTLGTDAAVERLTHHRADSIVRDAEAVREHLGATTWSSLGQSFGGFTTLSYLSTEAASLDRVFFTGGLSAVGSTTDDIYRLTYDKMRAATLRYYRRFPGHRAAMDRLVARASGGRIDLPSGEIVSVSRLRSIGTLLGSDDGWQRLWSLLHADPGTTAFRHDLADALPFAGRNPLYYVVHESCYADGGATNWAADRVEPDDFRSDPTLLTAEHVRREWLETVPHLQPWRDVADALAAHVWPTLYDSEALRSSEAHGAAAVYYHDVYVPLEASMETLDLIPGVTPWVTSGFEHSGLRSGDVLPRLFALAEGSVVR